MWLQAEVELTFEEEDLAVDLKNECAQLSKANDLHQRFEHISCDKRARATHTRTHTCTHTRTHTIMRD